MPSIDTLKIIGLSIVLGLFGLLILDRQALKTDIADQKTTITRLSDANDDFAAAAKRNNDALLEEAKIRADMETRYQAALKESEARNEASKKQQLAILNQKVTGDHCIYAHNLLTSYMKGRHP